MTKAQVVDTISQRTGINKEAVKLTIEALMECIMESLVEGKDVRLRRFGNFVVKKKPKKNFHAAPGKWILIPEHNEPFFRPCKEFKEQVKHNDK